MATLKEVVEKYGYGCKVEWRSLFSGNTYIYTLIKSPEKSFNYKYRLIGNDGLYTDFLENSDFKVSYISGGDKMSSDDNVLSRQDVDIVDKLCSKVLSQLKNDLYSKAINQLKKEILTDIIEKIS